MLRTNSGRLGIVLSSLFVVIGLAAPSLAPSDPLEMNLAGQHLSPSSQHWFGTDKFGRDILSRVLYGARISLVIGLLAVCVDVAVGVPVGMIAAYYGGRPDQILMRIVDVFIAFPTLLFALAVMAIRGAGFWNLILALTLKGWTTFARLTRAEVLSTKEWQFVESAKGLGASNRRIMWQHIMPNVFAPILVYATLSVSTPILTEASLSFLGLGLAPPTPSWGLIIAGERAYMRYAWWSVTLPGVALAIAILGMNLMGDALRDALDPTLVSRHSRSSGQEG
ncbi:MAG: ABC transporter permease [Armatimonadota bacterium]